MRATHLFLSDAEIMQIKAYMPQALREVAYLIVMENEPGQPVALMGVAGHRLEMLFIAPEARDAGLGRALLTCGVQRYGVNEQNPQAVGFYQHMGFETYRRTALDEQGQPYPLLYMRRTYSD